MQSKPAEVPSLKSEPGLSHEENLLLNTRLPHELEPAEMELTWDRYQAVIAGLLIRMGCESRMLDSIARVALVGSLDGIYARIALVPKLGNSALRVLGKH